MKIINKENGVTLTFMTSKEGNKYENPELLEV